MQKILIASLVFITFAAARSVNIHIFDLSIFVTETELLPPPPEISVEAQRDYLMILMNSTQTMKEFEENSRLWAEKHGLSEQMEKYGTKVQEMLKEFKEKYTSVVNNLASVEKQYTDIYYNETMTIAEISQDIEKLTKQYPLEFKTLGFVFEEMVKEIKENSNQRNNKKVLEVIQSKQEVMNSMKMLRKRR